MNEYLRNAVKVLEIIENTGTKAYIVGGYVRDYLLGEVDSTDIDIASRLRPDEVISLFEKTFKTGLSHGTVTIIFNNFTFEHTTFRKDVDYVENSRNAIVEFSDDIETDVKRRDFTINALAMDRDMKIYDFFDGRKDLENALIRTVGSPDKRFEEDSLRKLRAIRFAGKLGFDIEKTTLKSIIDNPSLKGVSYERIKTELDKIVISKDSIRALKLIEKTNLLAQIFPHFSVEKYDKSIKIVENLKHKDKKELSYAALFSLLDEDEIKNILNRLRFSNKEKKKIENLVRYSQKMPNQNKADVRVYISKLGLENIDEVLDLFNAKFLFNKLNKDLESLQNLRLLISEIKNEKGVYSRADLKINGSELIDVLALKKDEYKKLNTIFDVLLDACIKNPELNTRENLIKIAKEISV